MTQEQRQRNIVIHTTLRAAKAPTIYCFIGAILLALSTIDDFFPLTQWKQMFDITDKLGNIFIVIALTTFIYKFTALLCRRMERKLSERHTVGSFILGSVRKGLRIIFILATINILVPLIGPSPYYLNLIKTSINVIIIGSIGWIAVQIIYTFEALLFQQMQKQNKAEHLRAKALYTKMHILRNIATVVIIIICIAAILMSFSSFRNVGISLLASAGFLTAIIGLSGQKALFSIFSGLQIALSQPIKLGDIVVIENTTGIVEEITFTYVTLKLSDSRRLIVPINYFIDRKFENWSKDADGLRGSIHLHVDYRLPIDALRTELSAILGKSSFWDGRANKLQVVNLTENSVEVRVQVSASNADDISDLRAEVREKLLHFIRVNYAEYLPRIPFFNNLNNSGSCPVTE